MCIRYLVLLFVGISVSSGLVLAPAQPSVAADADPAVVAGTWTYRSFHNNPAPVDGNPNRALGLMFAEAVFTFDPPSGNTLKGAIDWPGGGLDLQGTVRSGSGGTPLTIEMIGAGRPGTGTEGWQYDYYGYLAHQWPAGVDQVPALVGSVIRAKPHGSAPAGYVASFIAVKRP